MPSLDVLRDVARGELTPEAALLALRTAAVADLAGVARVDLERAQRTGVPEVLLAGPKATEDVATIAAALLARTGMCPVSRVRPAQRRRLDRLARDHDATVVPYGTRSLLLLAPGATLPAPMLGPVGLLGAGTSDLEALAEVRLVLDCAGVGSRTVADVGVAGLHRLTAPLRDLLAADVAALVVAAGMDGALPSVVAGLAGVPVIGLPTSTGYGHGGRGRAALLSMLQSCAPGLVVVNIDNGIGAGAAAVLIARGRGGPPSA